MLGRPVGVKALCFNPTLSIKTYLIECNCHVLNLLPTLEQSHRWKLHEGGLTKSEVKTDMLKWVYGSSYTN